MRVVATVQLWLGRRSSMGKVTFCLLSAAPESSQTPARAGANIRVLTGNLSKKSLLCSTCDGGGVVADTLHYTDVMRRCGKHVFIARDRGREVCPACGDDNASCLTGCERSISSLHRNDDAFLSDVLVLRGVVR